MISSSFKFNTAAGSCALILTANRSSHEKECFDDRRKWKVQIPGQCRLGEIASRLKAQVLMREGNVAAALAAAKDAATGLSEREASHIAFSDLLFASRTDRADQRATNALATLPRGSTDTASVSAQLTPDGVIANPPAPHFSSSHAVMSE
jgi:hypothetical protein